MEKNAKTNLFGLIGAGVYLDCAQCLPIGDLQSKATRMKKETELQKVSENRKALLVHKINRY